jgi:seryl-tRNA synthetase
MLDIKKLRENTEEIALLLAKRGFKLDVEKFKILENQRKEIQTHTQELQNLKNTTAKNIGIAKSKGEEVSGLLKETENLGDQLKSAEDKLEKILNSLNEFLMEIPNLPNDSVPEGKDENSNQEIRKWGTPKTFDFTPKDHVELGENLKMLDFTNASKITGSRFVIMQDKLVKLHRALIQFMIDTHTKEHGYKEIYVPYIVNSDSLYGTGQLPKFKEDQFKINMTESNQDFYLIPTAEVPVTNMARNEIFDENHLPMKWVCHTPCFRSEAGSYGKDTRGMIRQHQFEKVELVHFTKPEDSYAAHESLTQHAEKILQKLNLPYRVMLLCGGDMGFGAAKTYDLEVWLPSQQKYREISSCSNTEAFQARRMQARYKNLETKKTEFIHTLNGSGLAVGRTLVAILENYQDKMGHIHIPEALLSYMDGLKIIT